MTIPKVRLLQTRAVSVPLAYPVRTASGDINTAPLLLIDLLTDQGVSGHAYLFTYTPLALKPVKSLLDNLVTVVQGQPCSPQEISRLLDARFRLLGNTGLVTMALAGIDMAVWDANARAAGLPLVRLLGGVPEPTPAYFSLGLDGVERGVELAHECLARGFKQMKIKLGYADVQEDLRVAKAVLQALGGAATLAVDYNQSLSTVEAIRRCRMLDDLGLAWIEEPTRREDDAGHAQISLAIHTPVMIGENWFGPQEMARSLEARASDLVMPDAMKIGGVSGWLEAAALANAARVPMSSHLFQEFSAHLLPVTPTGQWLEFLDLAAPVLQQPLRIDNGLAVIGESPGAGVEWDEEKVRHFEIN